MPLLYFAGLGLCVVLVTRYVLCVGIRELAEQLGLSSKVKGQILGYSTSVPELAGTVSTAAKGLLDAGLWNIAASNVINVFLFLSANLFYRQFRELGKVKFLDELGFALGAVALPLFLSLGGGWQQSPWTAVFLFGYFVVYLVVDQILGRKAAAAAGEPERPKPVRRSFLRLSRAVGLTLAGVAGIVVLGNYLGASAQVVVRQMHVPQVAVGWILGVATSLPELTSFFAIYADAKKSGELDQDLDTQEALDNLTASNMSNLGFIYPLGILVFLLFGR